MQTEQAALIHLHGDLDTSICDNRWRKLRLLIFEKALQIVDSYLPLKDRASSKL